MELTISCIGVIARRLLAREKHAHSMGATSRGCFLQLDSGWVIFLSDEVWRGPLTLNVHQSGDILRLLKSEMHASLDADQLYFPVIDVSFHFDRSEIWQAPPLPTTLLPTGQRQEKLRQIIEELRRMQRSSPLAELLPNLLGYEGHAAPPTDELFPLLVGVGSALLDHDPETLLTAAGKVLGLGAGLTPAGDDLMIGLALALSRWGHVLVPGWQMPAFAQELSALASLRTTTLSANLIECACLGEANERLILALDGIMTGEHHPARCAESLASWGNTSGIDALVGMALVMGDW